MTEVIPLADNSVTGLAIADGTVTNTDLANSAITITAGNGLVNGGTTVLGSSVAISVDGFTTGTTTTVASNSGVEATADGVRLLGGCGDTEILKWSLGGESWQCAADQIGSVATNSLDFAELKDTLALDATTTINAGANDFVFNAETFTYRTGFIDSVSAESVDGCFVRYSHAINGAKWQGVCRNNSVESVCDTGVAVSAGSWVRLTVAVNTAGNTVDFLTDGTSRCQIATNIPIAAGRSTGFGSFLIKSVGTTAWTVDVDYLEVTGRLATSR